jgi:formylglycine-generating enzyme required for sulfatase activity
MRSPVSLLPLRRHALYAAVALDVLLALSCKTEDPGEDKPDSGSSSRDAAVRDSGAPADASPVDTVDTGGSAGDGGVFSCPGNASFTQMVAVPAGSYIIGCNAAVDSDCASNELPMHTVQLSAFQIEKTEVTQAEYAACVAVSSCGPPSCAWDCSKAEYPATCIVWDQAKEYCTWAGRRLPSEAEWEAASRGPTGLKYPWGNQDPDCTLVNMSGCSGGTDPVGSHPTGASPFGALDMAGNVVEMVEDWYSADYYQVSPSTNPTGPATGTEYGGRGGGYASVAVWQRSSSRDWYDITDDYKSLGFRCAD